MFWSSLAAAAIATTASVGMPDSQAGLAMSSPAEKRNQNRLIHSIKNGDSPFVPLERPSSNGFIEISQSDNLSGMTGVGTGHIDFAHSIKTKNPLQIQPFKPHRYNQTIDRSLPEGENPGNRFVNRTSLDLSGLPPSLSYMGPNRGSISTFAQLQTSCVCRLSENDGLKGKFTLALGKDMSRTSNAGIGKLLSAMKKLVREINDQEICRRLEILMQSEKEDLPQVLVKRILESASADSLDIKEIPEPFPQYVRHYFYMARREKRLQQQDLAMANDGKRVSKGRKGRAGLRTA